MTRAPSPAASTAVRTTRARSSSVRVWYSPSEPFGTTPSQPLSSEPADVIGVGVVVDGQIVAQGQCGGDHDAAPGAGVVPVVAVMPVNPSHGL